MPGGFVCWRYKHGIESWREGRCVWKGPSEMVGRNRVAFRRTRRLHEWRCFIINVMLVIPTAFTQVPQGGNLHGAYLEPCCRLPLPVKILGCARGWHDIRGEQADVEICGTFSGSLMMTYALSRTLLEEIGAPRTMLMTWRWLLDLPFKHAGRHVLREETA